MGRLGRGRIVALALLVTGLGLGGAELALRSAGFEGLTAADLQASAGFGPGWVRRRDGQLGSWLQVVREEGVVPRVRLDPAHAALGMRAQSFSLERRPEELRLFALGGASTALPPGAPESAWPRQLQALLTARDPTHRWAVVGLGLAGLDAQEQAVQAREALAVGAQGLLILPGEDDLRAALTDALTAPPAVRPWHDRVRVLRLLRALARPRDAARPRVAVDRDARERALVERVVVEAAALGCALRPDEGRTVEPLYARMLADLMAGLEALTLAADGAGVPVWLGIPPLDPWAAPREGLPDPRLDPATRAEVSEAVQQAMALFARGRVEEARERVARALGLDPTHAQACWMGGMLAWADGEAARAKDLFTCAADHDLRSRRMDSPRRAVLQAVCDAHPEIRCLDLGAAFAGEDELPAQELFTATGLPSPGVGMPVIAEVFGEAVLAWGGWR
ncbi:MAG: hypothetical protein ABIO70_28805 [Pseudomonadota bacterium]